MVLHNGASGPLCLNSFSKLYILREPRTTGLQVFALFASAL
jgi:hypothetical protein